MPDPNKDPRYDPARAASPYQDEHPAATPSPHDVLVKRVEGYTASAMRDSLREAIRTAQVRRLNDDEALIFQYMLNELEVRGKAGKRG